MFAGALVVTGAGGDLLLGGIGLLMSVPLLRRLRRRFSNWWAPVIAVGAFAAMFAVSALVIGPAIASSQTGPGSRPAPADPSAVTTDPSGQSADVDHEAHHAG